jgi:SNF2 family DNA or RNA helicase
VARLAGGAPKVQPEQRRFQVLAAITELRLLACHPRLHEPDSTVPSSKLARFLELAADLADAGHRTLVFSQFTSHLALVREALDAAGASYLYLDGKTPPPERDRLVARFQAGEGQHFLISLKAGGTGLNLTAADYVIHLDPWWNPAVEDQATDRAHRIGQTRPVTVYRLVSQATIEETIVRLHEQKRELVAGILDGMDAAGRLSADELLALIRSGPGDDAPAVAEAGEVELEPAAAPTAARRRARSASAP